MTYTIRCYALRWFVFDRHPALVELDGVNVTRSVRHHLVTHQPTLEAALAWCAGADAVTVLPR